MAAITVTKQVLENGARNYIAIYNATFAMADTLAAYDAADPTSGGDMGVIIGGATLYPNTHLKVWKLNYNMVGDANGLVMSWDASSAQAFWTVTGFGKQDFKKSPGGLYVPQNAGAPIAGATGKILWDFTAAVAGSFSIEMWLKKDIVQ